MPAIVDLNMLTTVELIDLIIQVSRTFGNFVNIERIARGVPAEIGRNENTSLTISPNPAAEYIEICLERCATLSKCGTSKNVDIKIYNTLGECVLTVGIQNFEPLQRIDVSQLPVGLYFIQIGNYSEKFMVVR